MLIYKDCIEESEGLQYTCDPCDITEGGGVRSLCLLKKGTVLPIPLTLQAIEILIVQNKLWVMPETRGSFDGGTPKMVTGYGNNKERQIGSDYVLQVSDPLFTDNYAFWSAVEKVEDWNIAFRTETQLAVIYSDCTITTKAPSEEAIDTEVVWNIEAKWFSKEKPLLIDYPLNLFENIFKTYEFITGLTIPPDGKISVEVDSGRTAYVIQPDGSILTSVGGIIDTTLGGDAGAVTLIVPTNVDNTLHLGNAGSIVTASDFIGQLTTNYKGDMSLESCPNITGINAPNSTNINTYNCASFTADSVKLLIDNAYTLFLAGQLTGAINAGGTTVGIDTSDVSTVHGSAYATMIAEMTGWSISINTL